MGQIAGQNGELSPPGLERPQFVADLTLCVADWERALGGHMIPPDALANLTRQGNALVQRSVAMGFGGIGHHLSELVRSANQGADVNSLRGRLDVVRELLGQARNALNPQEAAWASGRVMPSGPPPGMAGGGMAAPPPMITVHGRSREVGSPVAGPGLAPPKMLFQSAIVQKGSEAPPAPPPHLGASAHAPNAPQAPSLGLPPLAPVPALAPQPPSPPGYGPPPQAAPPAPFSPGGLGPQPPSPGFGGPIPNPPMQPNPGAPPPMFGGAQPMAPKAAPLLGLLEGSGGAPSPGIKQPNLFVRSVLGLRVGRKSGEAGAGPPPLAPLGQPSGQSASGLLGLKPGAAAAPVAPPPMLNSYAGMPQGLPGLKPDPRGGHGLRSDSKGGSFPPLGRDPTPVPPGRSTNPRGRSGDHRISDHGRDMSRGRDTGRNRGGRGRLPQQRESRWWIGVFAVGGIAVVIGLIVVVAVTASKRNDAVAPAPSASTSGALASKGDAPLPGRKLSTEKESLQFMLRQIHGRGGKESNELRNLIDEQFAIIHENCVGPRCAELRKVLLSTGPKINIRRRVAPDSMRSKWLAGLQMPEGLHVEDDPLVQRRFEFYTENPVGRETLQQMLFRCGAFRDMIQSTLVKNNMPAALIAVVFVESGCSPLAKSPAGAEGLWQFIPAAARAYHLQVREGVVDERHSPQKSTEAAVKFLSDMYAKFGDWDLVFAGYNMGPYGLAARINTIAGDEKVTFWDLVDAKMLPEETQGYAPSIEAIALILNNLQRLKFTAVQMRAPQVTADLEVPPNTRLTLIARAAAMSLNELRSLNLDLKALSTPPTPNFAVQVPKDSIWQARDTLKELLKSKDDADMCVPPNFDWGRQRFTPDMAKNCDRALAAAQQELQAPQPAPAPLR